MTSQQQADIAGYPPFLARHRGLLTAAQVARLREVTVAVAGVGGVGGRVAEVLARSGIGRLRLADPDVFTESNLNRQAGSLQSNLGENKARVLASLCEGVSPLVAVECYEDGVTPENVAAFMAGADVLVDGTDYATPSIGLRLARTAAAAKTPTVIGVEVAFGAWHSVLRAPGDFEQLLGVPRDVSPDALDDGRVTVDLWRWIARVPPYVSLDALQQLSHGEIEAPAIAPAVELSAALVATDVLRLVLGQPVVATAPRVHLVDAMTGRATTFRPTKARFVASLARARLSGRRSSRLALTTPDLTGAS